MHTSAQACLLSTCTARCPFIVLLQSYYSLILCNKLSQLLQQLHLLLCRLTAFALGSFSEMAHFYDDASFIDDGVMSAAFSYLRRKQNESGCFKLEGAVHNYRLLVCCAALTVRTSLKGVSACLLTTSTRTKRVLILLFTCCYVVCS